MECGSEVCRAAAFLASALPIIRLDPRVGSFRGGRFASFATALHERWPKQSAQRPQRPASRLGAAQCFSLGPLPYCVVLCVVWRLGGAAFGFSLTGGLSGSGSGWVIWPTTVTITLGVAV